MCLFPLPNISFWNGTHLKNDKHANILSFPEVVLFVFPKHMILNRINTKLGIFE